MTLYGLMKLGFAVITVLSAAAVAGNVLLTKKVTLPAVFLLAVLAAAVFVFIQAHYIEPNWIKIERVKIRDAALAKAVGNAKIVQITDIHLTGGLGYREKKLIEKVNALKPDILFFTGDVIDDLTQTGPALELFRSFRVKHGIYAVPGNTDHIVMDSGSLKRLLARANVDVLINEPRKIELPEGREFWIAGVDDPKYGFDKLKQALSGIPQGEPVILLAHSPEIFDKAVNTGVNLILAGDTHGGQVGIDFLIRRSRYANRTPYMRGLFRKGKTAMYVNRGIGTKTLPVRFLCRPEIAVIEAV